MGICYRPSTVWLLMGLAGWFDACGYRHALVVTSYRNLACSVSQDPLHLFLSAIPGFRCRSRAVLRARFFRVCRADLELGALGIVEADFDGLINRYCDRCMVCSFAISSRNRR